MRVEIIMSKYVVTALYKFVNLENFKEIRQPLLDFMTANKIKGTLLLAKEGINGTVAGSQKSIENLWDWLEKQPGLENINHKESFTNEMPFYRTKVKLKKEIVTLGVEGTNPLKTAGTYVKPKDWNSLISDPDTILVDTRNDYEIAIGTFQNAIDPETKTFREFPKWAEKNLKDKKDKKVAMFCTGGIRCEKSTAYLKDQGFDEVYHLEGGILKYLEEIPKTESMWQGDCFVFDNRVAVNHDLQRADYEQCFACRLPITAEDMQSHKYMQGISCPHCFDNLTDVQKQRFTEREKQLRIAKERGECHIGGEAIASAKKRRAKKIELKEQQRQASK